MKLYYFPPSSYSMKVLLACAEKQIQFEPQLVNMFDPDSAAQYREINPLGKIPMLMPTEDHKIPEASIIIEYLDTHFDSAENTPKLIPLDPEASRKVRFHDRMLDLYLQDSAAPLFFELMKPEAEQDAERITLWRERIGIMYGYMEQTLADSESGWMYGDTFSLVDISAACALYVGQMTMPLDDYPAIKAFYQRMAARPSMVKALADAQPYLDAMAA